MPRVGFKPAISTFERPNTVRVSDCSAIETGNINYTGAKCIKIENYCFMIIKD
jgi:hypothetical protein